MPQSFNTPSEISQSLIFSVNRMLDKGLAPVRVEFSEELAETEKADFELEVRAIIKRTINFEWLEKLAPGDSYKPIYELKISTEKQSK